MLKARAIQIIIKAAGYVGLPSLSVDDANRILAVVMGVITLITDLAIHQFINNKPK